MVDYRSYTYTRNGPRNVFVLVRDWGAGCVSFSPDLKENSGYAPARST